MSDELTFTPADLRRGTALLAHYATGDRAGIREIWREAAEADSWPGLAAAVIAAVFEAAPDLRSEQGVAWLRDLATAHAALEADDDSVA
jgi:hypothetical protein